MVREAPREHTNRSLSTQTWKVRREDRSLKDVDGDDHMDIENCVVYVVAVRPMSMTWSFVLGGEVFGQQGAGISLVLDLVKARRDNMSMPLARNQSSKW